MTTSETTVPPLSEKLSLVTHHHLLTRVPVKLDLDDWNFGSWEYFFDQLCSTYDVGKYIHQSTEPTSLTSEELNVDKIVLSWLFTTLSDPLQRRLVVARPKSAKAAWTMTTDIVKDNKRSRTAALKAEMRSLKLGDLSMESYFGKIESLSTILESLDAKVNDEDVVHFALDGLPEKYDQVCGIMHHKEVFPDLKTARSMLVTEEMRLKSKSIVSPIDYSSSSPTALLADSGSTRRPHAPQNKSWRPCYNFAKGSCRFGVNCKFVHDPTVQTRSNNNGPSKEKVNDDLLAKLCDRLGLNNKTDTTGILGTPASPQPMAYYSSARPSSPIYSPYMQPFGPVGPPPGFSFGPAHGLPYGLPQHGLSHYPSPVHQPTTLAQPAPTAPSAPNNSATTSTLGQETVLPHAFFAGTLHDPNTGAWNMDTGPSPM